jgi:hypothetical protein
MAWRWESASAPGRACARQAGIGQRRRHWTHEDATKVMAEAGLKPLEEFPGTDAPWRCECLRCGDVVTARLQKIRTGDGCCKRCGVAASARARSADAAGAEAMMRAAKLEPLEPYPGGNHLPWRCGAWFAAR